MVNLDDDEEEKSPPWPRVLRNYPIILSVVVLQFIWALALIMDPSALNVTAIRSLLLLHITSGSLWSGNLRAILVTVLMATATLSALGFMQRRKIFTIIAMIPQQFVMFICSIGLVHFIWDGHFADGTVRTPFFLLADQSSPIFLTLFHTWALVLIIIHAGD